MVKAEDERMIRGIVPHHHLFSESKAMHDASCWCKDQSYKQQWEEIAKEVDQIERMINNLITEAYSAGEEQCGVHPSSDEVVTKIKILVVKLKNGHEKWKSLENTQNQL